MEMKQIGEIGNYYGGLKVAKKGRLYFWAIENWDGHTWSQIPKSLYDALVEYEENKNTKAKCKEFVTD